MGHHVLMGRKTYDSLPNQLKGRKEIVVSGKSAIKLLDKVRVIPSIELAIIYATTNYESELFIIGGAQIYKEAINYADRMIITRVNLNPIGDTFFPEINSDKWMVVDEQKQSQLYSFVEYKRIKNYE